MAAAYRSKAILLLALVMAACGTQPSEKALTVDALLGRIDSLNGQTVRVFGYLPRCEVLSCALYRTKADSEKMDRSMQAMRAPLDSGATDVSNSRIPPLPSLEIGHGATLAFFDTRARLVAGNYVVITGKVTNQCRSKGKPVCLDRGSDLEPAAIRKAPVPN